MHRWENKLFAVALVLFACNLQVAHAKDSVRIVSLSPSTDKPLRVGEIVTVEIKVEADADTSETMRRLFVGYYRTGVGPLVAWNEVVPKGQNTRTFKGTFRVPETGQISAWAAITDGTVQSNRKRPLASDTKEYSVVDASGRKPKVPSTADDKVTIAAITPAAGSTLKTGDNVAFDLKVNYELRSAETGRVVWMFINAGNLQSVLSSQAIQKGKGTLSLSRSLQIRTFPGPKPAVFVLLIPSGSVRGTFSDYKTFQVEQAVEDRQDSKLQISVDATGEFEDHLKITPVAPPLQTPLRPGQMIDFELKVEYDVNSVDATQLDVYFGDTQTYATARIPTYATDSRIVEKGRGSVIVTRRLWIPTELTDDFPVSLRLSAPASATDTVRYKVSP